MLDYGLPARSAFIWGLRGIFATGSLARSSAPLSTASAYEFPIGHGSVWQAAPCSQLSDVPLT